MTTKAPTKQVNKAAVAFFAGKLVSLARDDDAFENAFIDTDLGGSSCSLDAGLEALFTDGDPLMGTGDRKAEEAWIEAHEHFCELVESDALLARSVDAFDARAGEESQWKGNGPRPIQRRLIAVARNILRDLYADAQLPAAARWQDTDSSNKVGPSDG